MSERRVAGVGLEMWAGHGHVNLWAKVRAQILSSQWGATDSSKQGRTWPGSRYMITLADLQRMD